MEQLIRAFNWSDTSLGSIDHWPQSLKTAVNIILQSPVPMVMLWGADGIMIYNDSYSFFAGARHPFLLGSKVMEGWPEVADFNRNVMNTGLKGETLSYKDQRLTLYRNNVAEEVWMNLNYSPIMDESGSPAGVLSIVVETTQRILAEQKQTQAEEALLAERQRLFNLFMNAPAAISIFSGPDLIFQLANAPYQKLVGKDRDMIGKPLLEAIPDVEPGLLQIIKNVAFKGERFAASELPVVLDWDLNGTSYPKYLNFIYEPVYEEGKPNGFMAFIYDVTEQVKSRRIIEEQNRVLEMATSGASLTEVLSFLIQGIESQSNNRMIGSVLLLDKEGKHLFNGAAPSLPEEYNAAIDGITIGPTVGSCGTAAYTKKSVVVSNIATDPLWKDFKELALKHNLQSCWSTPLLSGEKVLGTFALYSHQPAEPTEEDKRIIDFAARTARLVIERKEIENTLLESEEQLRALVTATSDVIYVMSPDWSEMGLLDGRVFVPNPGKPLGDWKWFDANVPAAEHPRVRKVIEEAIRTKSVFQLEHGVIKADGTTGWTSSRAIPILDKNGEILKWFGAATDITDRKEVQDALKESEERFRSLADQSPMIVFIIEPNAEATISYWSKTWLNYTGQTYEQALGRAWDGIVHPDDVPTVLDIYVPAFKNRQPYTIPAIRLKRYDGEYRWHHFKASPRYLPNGEFMGFVGVGIDINDQQVALEELGLKNTQLLRINNDLDNFIYTASHDLKAPMSNLEGLFNTLLSEVTLEEGLMPLKGMIEKSFDRFKNTIIDLTEISKVQKGDNDIKERIEFTEIVEDVKLGIKDLLDKYNPEIETNFLVKEIKFSRKNLRSILYNFISNAIKYSSPDRRPLIRISTERINNTIALTISDNGLGISEHNQKKVFQMFKRFHDHIEGSGIGLYIVKRIIDNSGGKIELTSEVNKGTTFRIVLPD